jgi:hypothetical protein
MKKLGIALAVLSVLLLAAAAGLRYFVVPAKMVLPADTNTTIVYDGTVSGVNSEAAAKGDLAHLIMHNLPVRVERTVKVLESDKTRALVNDHAVVTFVDSGAVFATNDYFYTLDRKTMHSVPNFTTHAAENSDGIMIGFPFGTEKHPYTGWVQEMLSSAEVGYDSTDDDYGLTTYRFSGTARGTVTDPATLAKLPTELPKEQLGLLAMALDLPTAMQKELAAATPSLPAIVPLQYGLVQDGTFSVDPTTGIIVDMHRSTVTSIMLNQAPGVQIPVSMVKIEYSQQDVDDQVLLAKNSNATAGLVGTTIPAALLIFGLLCLLGSIPLIRRRRRPPVAGPPLSRIPVSA